ncbi:MAG TPA: polysaccharide biosynthesis/export family protein [Polyangiaceae bacterium]
MLKSRTFRLLGAVAFALPFAMPLGCSSPGAYVWVNELPPQYVTRSQEGYVIRDGDTLNVRVFNQEALSTHAKVRSDGRIAIPALGDVDVRGKHPAALKAELETRLRDYVNAPSVTVTVEEMQPIVVSVLGEVAHPGTFNVDSRATIAQVLASAGGLTDYASRDRIFIVRAGPPPVRVRFTYEEITRGAAPSEGFVLADGDLLEVE